jgi:hypothetical protein
LKAPNGLFHLAVRAAELIRTLLDCGRVQLGFLCHHVQREFVRFILSSQLENFTAVPAMGKVFSSGEAYKQPETQRSRGKEKLFHFAILSCFLSSP